MRDLRKYWKDVHTLAGSLPAFVWVVSEDGCLVETAAEVAAKLLIAKSHRLATQHEIRARAEKEKARNREVAAETRRKRGVEVVAVNR